MTIYNPFLMSAQLVNFSGDITYNSSGFAVLPPYSISPFLASMQPIRKSELKFLPQGTHYADYLQLLTDYPIYVDFEENTSLGNYVIYNNNTVYKIISEQNFLPFIMLPTNHIETTIVKDNRITYNGSELNIPFPEIEGPYAPLFDLIGMVNFCFVSPSLPTLWAFQQELAPNFPYCTVSLEAVENIDNTNFSQLYIDNNSFNRLLTTNISQQLIVKFSFYSLDQLIAMNLMEKFKLNFPNFPMNNSLFQFIGFVEGENKIEKELYEDRTVFSANCFIRFSFIVQQQVSSNQTIDIVAFTLSIPPVL